MNASTRINLHCHSTCSDGILSPEALARRLADAGVLVAALTDHETVEGVERFRSELQRFGICSVTGVEIPVVWRGLELHLLVYGFDLASDEWLETLRGFRLKRESATHSVAGSLRRMGNASSERASAASNKKTDSIEEIITRAHRAGGRVFLAHPALLPLDEKALTDLIQELKGYGLDGLEALYAPSPRETQERLVRIAREARLLVSAGTDYHQLEDDRKHGIAVDMPLALWQPLRKELQLEAVTTSSRVATAYTEARRSQWAFGRHVFFPALLAIVLFVATIWGLLLPAFERGLLDRKREMIRELTRAARTIMTHAEQQVQAGRMTRAEAQQEALGQIGALRYGHENKDYFWLQDMHPRMIMHPYRPELNGKDLSEFKDQRGVRIFVEFAEVVRRHQEGYVDYVWQWPDDPSRLEPKESYIAGFAPWGWVIGTGLYMEDVQQEIARLERGLIHASLLITVIITLLLLHVVRHSRRIDRVCSTAVDNLHATTERYRSLLEAATEGTLLILDGRCRYANPYLLSLLGYSASELELLDLTEVLPTDGANAEIWKRLEALKTKGEVSAEALPGELCRRDGSRTPCVLAPSRISLGGKIGLVLLAREAAIHAENAILRPLLNELGEAAEHLPIGIFSARADSKGSVIAANPIAKRFLRVANKNAEEGTLRLADLFPDEASFGLFLEKVKQEGKQECRIPLLSPEGQGLTLALRAALGRHQPEANRVIDGFLEDVSSSVLREHERDAMIERLQSSMLFLHQPVRSVLKPCIFCSSNMPVSKVAALMASKGVTATLVQDASGETVGIATAHDLCNRVLATEGDGHRPIRFAMSAPIVAVSADVPVYEALLKMQESQLQHLGVSDATGAIIGLLSDRELLPFQKYGAIVLTTQISRASLVEDVVRSCHRTAGMIKALLDSGAHPRNLTTLLASVCDAATSRFVELAIEELGPPPTRFAFVALGSQGRLEQTLVTDQDNAIIYAPVGDHVPSEEVASYFLEMGRRVCSWLNEAGYPFCRGKFMAQNPVWSRPLSSWKTHFSYWAERAEPSELLNFTVFFDFRAVCGDSGVITELRQHVFSELKKAPSFFPHFARHALLFKAPVMLLGRIISGNMHGMPRGTVDLKAAMLPIVAFARLYALQHDIAQTNTLDRLDALVEKGHLSPESRDEIVATYTFLMKLRLQHQVKGLHAGQALDNLIELRSLGYTDRSLLRQAFAHIRVLQHRVAYDFLGGLNG
jgi:PAS domain S-box-containing protein